MRFSVALSTAEAPGVFDRFLQIIGEEPWRRRYATLRREVLNNPMMDGFVATRHGIELSVGQLLELRDAGHAPSEISTPQDYAALSFIAPIVLAYDQLSPTARTRVAGILRDGLNTDRGLRPFQSEIETAVQLMHAGFDVSFWDLERGGGFDFLAVRDNVELEVECKSISGDFGRQIHDRHMRALSDRIRQVIKGIHDQLNGGRLVRVTFPARLPGDHAVHADVANAVKAALAGGEPSSPHQCAIEVREFDLKETPFSSDPDAVTEEVTRRFLAEHNGEDNVHAAVLMRPGKSAIVVVVDSRRRRSIVAQLLRDLKDAANAQFSRVRAAVLVVQFLEMGPDAMFEFAAHDSQDPKKASALQIATNLLFQHRPHVHSVVYRSHGTLTRDSNSVQEKGPTYRFTNSSHSHAQDKRYSLFRSDGSLAT